MQLYQNFKNKFFLKKTLNMLTDLNRQKSLTMRKIFT